MRVYLVLIVLFISALACSTADLVDPVPSPTLILPEAAIAAAVPASEGADGSGVLWRNESPVKMFVCVDALNVRAAPSAQAMVFGTLVRGDKVYVEKVLDGWAYIGSGRWVNSQPFGESTLCGN